MKKRTIGVIGVGAIGSRHARNLKKLGHSVLTYDPARWRTEIKEILEASEAFVVASPTPTHLQYLDDLSLLEKPIFVEKPIADKLHAEHKEVKMVGYNLRFHSCVITAKGWIEAGHLGTPLWANLVCAQKSKSKDSVLLNWSHEIDLALYLLGPAYLRAAATNPAETIADLTLWHESGCQSTIHLDYLTEPEIRQTIIVGSKAKIILDLVNRYAWLQDANGTMLDHTQGQDSYDQNYIDEIDTFLARCDGTKTIGCTAAEGLEVLKICLEAQKLAAIPKAA